MVDFAQDQQARAQNAALEVLVQTVFLARLFQLQYQIRRRQEAFLVALLRRSDAQRRGQLASAGPYRAREEDVFPAFHERHTGLGRARRRLEVEHLHGFDRREPHQFGQGLPSMFTSQPGFGPQHLLQIVDKRMLLLGRLICQVGVVLRQRHQ